MAVGLAGLAALVALCAGLNGGFVGANVAREQYPTQFALSLIHKDLRLVLDEAYAVSVPMPATAAAQQLGCRRHGAGERQRCGLLRHNPLHGGACWRSWRA